MIKLNKPFKILFKDESYYENEEYIIVSDDGFIMVLQAYYVVEDIFKNKFRKVYGDPWNANIYPFDNISDAVIAKLDLQSSTQDFYNKLDASWAEWVRDNEQTS